MLRLSLLPLLLLTAGALFSQPASAEWNVTGALPLDAKYVAVNPVTNRVYVSTPDALHVLDGLTHETLHTVPMYEAVHIAVDTINNQLYLSGSELTLMDASTYRILDADALDANQHYGRAANGFNYYLTDRGCSAADCKSFVEVHRPHDLEIVEWITTPHRNPLDVAVPETVGLPSYISYASTPVLSVFTWNRIWDEIPMQEPIAQLQYDTKNELLYALEAGGKHLTVINAARNQNKVTARYDLRAQLKDETVRSMALNPATGELVFYAQKNGNDFPYLISLNRWKGAATTTNEGLPALQYDSRIEMIRPLGRFGYFPSPGMTYNPATGRIYVVYGGTVSIPEQNRLVVIEEKPPVDTLPPTATVTLQEQPNASGWYRSGVRATITARDNFNGLGVDTITAKRFCCGDSTPPTLLPIQLGNQMEVFLFAPPPSTEPWWVEYTVRDIAGNETTGRITANIDPYLPVTTPRISGAPGGLTQVALEAVDAPGGSGVGGIWYALDGGTETLYTGPFTVSADRTHELRYFARDIAGNQELAQSLTVRLSGDMNGDLTVDVADVVHLLRGIVSRTVPTPQELGAGDWDGSGTLDVTDAVLILRQIVALPG